jgi:hypothetical protein
MRKGGQRRRVLDLEYLRLHEVPLVYGVLSRIVGKSAPVETEINSSVGLLLAGRALGLDAGECFRRPLADRLSDDKDLKGGPPARCLSHFCDSVSCATQ